MISREKVFQHQGSAQYIRLGRGDNENDDQQFQHDTPTRQPSVIWRRVLQVIPWLTTLLFASTTLSVIIKSSPTDGLGSFEKGWVTDFATSRPFVEARQQRFIGSPSFHENKTMYIPHPGHVRYTGVPGPEIDENWRKLTWGRYILITEEEAHAAWGENIDEFWDNQRGGYVAGLDMFHTLHCLNNLRKTIYPEYYPPQDEDPNHRLHQNHCIEQLRQYVICSGDMTPIPTRYYAALDRNYVDSDVPHTCRNFEKLRDWMVDRYEGPSAVAPSTRPHKG